MKQEELKGFLEELKMLVDIESPTDHIDGIHAVANCLAKKAESLGFKHKMVDLKSDKVGNCLFVSNNFDAKEFDILFVGHLDTVFPVGTKKRWEEKDGKINALGIIDDKAGCLLALYIMKELNPKLNVALYCNSHEETGSNYTKEQIREYAKKSKYCLVVEPARADGSLVATRKGLCSYTIEFFGKAAHAGNNPQDGASAVAEAANFITQFATLNDYEEGHTFNSVMLNGGTAQNVVPHYASVNIEMRYKRPSSLEFFNKKLDEVLNNPIIKGTSFKKTLTIEEGPMNDEINIPKIKKLFDEAANALGQKVTWVDAGGLSDGNIAAAAGCPTIDGLGPTGGNMHMEEEYLVVDSIVPKCNLVVEVIKKLF